MEMEGINTKYEELTKEMWDAYRENVRFIKTHNIKKIKDQPQDIQDEFKRLEKIVHEKEQLLGRIKRNTNI